MSTYLWLALLLVPPAVTFSIAYFGYWPEGRWFSPFLSWGLLSCPLAVGVAWVMGRPAAAPLFALGTLLGSFIGEAAFGPRLRRWLEAQS